MGLRLSLTELGVKSLVDTTLAEGPCPLLRGPTLGSDSKKVVLLAYQEVVAKLNHLVLGIYCAEVC